MHTNHFVQHGCLRFEVSQASLTSCLILKPANLLYNWGHDSRTDDNNRPYHVGHIWFFSLLLFFIQNKTPLLFKRGWEKENLVLYCAVFFARGLAAGTAFLTVTRWGLISSLCLMIMTNSSKLTLITVIKVQAADM